MRLSLKLFFLVLIVSNCKTQAQNPWLIKADFSGDSRYGGTGFSIDSLGFICMGYNNQLLFNDLWQYNFITDIWTQKANCPGVIRRAPVSFSIEKKGYVGTGYGNILLDDFWEYDLTTNTWLAKADFPGGARYGCVSFSINGKGYLGLGNEGTSSGPFQNDLWEYDPLLDTWTEKTSFPGAVRFGAVAFTDGVSGYVVAGGNATSVFNDHYQFDPVQNSWTQKASIPGGRAYPFTFCFGGKGYVGGGTNNGVLDDFYSYDIANNTWTADSSYPGGSGYAASFFSIDNKGYVGTGGDGSNFFTDFWQYSPCEKTYLSSITAVGPTEFCQGDSVVLSANSANGYLWSNGALTQSIVVKNTGNYSVTITDVNSCTSSSQAVSVTVFPAPPVPSIMVNGNLIACSESGMANYQWFLNGNLFSTCSSEFCNCVQDGFYRVIITDANGCLSSSALANVFCSVGMDEDNNLNKIRIFPNPGNGLFRFEIPFEVNNIKEIRIFNYTGMLVYSEKTGNRWKQEIDLSIFSAGLYLAELITTDEIITYKLEIKK